MKWFLVILTLGFVSCAKQIVISEEDLKLDVFYTEQALKPYTGTCKIYYYNTDIIKEEFRFKKGRLNGESLSYYRNGNLRWKGSYHNGLLTGKWKNWDAAGTLILEVNYINDTLEGPYVAMYPNGKIKEKGTFAANKRVGEWIRMDEKGKIISDQ